MLTSHYSRGVKGKPKHMSSFCWRKAELSAVSSSSEFESESASLDSDSVASAWTFLR